MTNTESIFATMRILKAPPIPTQKIAAPTIEQLNASNPERRAIALGAVVVAPVALLFALICFMMMPPAPPSAAEVARQNHILTVADGPGEAAPSNPIERQKNEWLPDPDAPGLVPSSTPRYPQPASSKGKAMAGGVDENGDAYEGIEIWPAGPGVHVRPDGKPAKAVVTDGPEHVVKAEKGKRVVAVIETPSKSRSAVEPASGGRTAGASEPKVLVKGNERHEPKAKAVSHPSSKHDAPAASPSPSPSCLEGEDDLKKPTLD